LNLDDRFVSPSANIRQRGRHVGLGPQPDIHWLLPSGAGDRFGIWRSVSLMTISAIPQRNMPSNLKFVISASSFLN
jgi:hypothetical protein